MYKLQWAPLILSLPFEASHDVIDSVLPICFCDLTQPPAWGWLHTFSCGTTSHNECLWFAEPVFETFLIMNHKWQYKFFGAEGKGLKQSSLGHQRNFFLVGLCVKKITMRVLSCDIILWGWLGSKHQQEECMGAVRSRIWISGKIDCVLHCKILGKNPCESVTSTSLSKKDSKASSVVRLEKLAKIFRTKFSTSHTSVRVCCRGILITLLHAECHGNCLRSFCCIYSATLSCKCKFLVFHKMSTVSSCSLMSCQLHIWH